MSLRINKKVKTVSLSHVECADERLPKTYITNGNWLNISYYPDMLQITFSLETRLERYAVWNILCIWRKIGVKRHEE